MTTPARGGPMTTGASGQMAAPSQSCQMAAPSQSGQMATRARMAKWPRALPPLRDLAEDRLEHLEPEVDVLVDGHRRDEHADHVALDPGGHQHQTAVLGLLADRRGDGLRGVAAVQPPGPAD